jgi:hypothetical protein
MPLASSRERGYATSAVSFRRSGLEENNLRQLLGSVSHVYAEDYFSPDHTCLVLFQTSSAMRRPGAYAIDGITFHTILHPNAKPKPCTQGSGLTDGVTSLQTFSACADFSFRHFLLRRLHRKRTLRPKGDFWPTHEPLRTSNHRPRLTICLVRPHRLAVLSIPLRRV